MRRPDRTGLERRLSAIVDDASRVEGYMSRRDMMFLALLAAWPVAEGDVLEIGSHRGRSTVLLAKAAAVAGQRRIVAVDPLPNPGRLPDQPERIAEGRAVLEAYLRRSGVRDQVEFHQMRSDQLAQNWRRPLRLLWIDGDHSCQGKRLDFQLWSPHLADGAVLAIHDVLNPLEGGVRVFTENVLRSPHFGPAGVVGSIGWARFWTDPRRAAPYEEQKRRLGRRLQPLIPYHDLNGRMGRWSKLRYRLLRWRVPHEALSAAAWRKLVA